MFKQFVVGLALCLFAGQALASEVYIPAAAAEFPSSNPCVPATRSGANGRLYTVVTCAAGQTFYATLSVPQDASSFIVQPYVSWVTQSSDATGVVCWNIQGTAFPASNVASTYDNFSFLGSASNPGTGQTSNGVNKMNITGQFGSTGSVDFPTNLGTHIIQANAGLLTDCNTGNTVVDCRSKPWVVKVTRSVSCSGTGLTGTADFVSMRLTVN